MAGGPVGINWLDASGPNDSSVALDLGTLGAADGLSQFSSDYNISFVIKNGAEVGELNGVAVDQEGFVIAELHQRRDAEDLQAADRDLRQPAGARSAHRQRVCQTAASGEFNLRDAGRGGAGMIAPSSLESANVDLGEEFTKMIVTQRAYSANARVITTTDEMLDELIRISG